MGDARARGAAEGAPARTAPHFGAEVLAYGQEARSIELQMLARLQAPAIPGDPGGLLADEGAETTERLAPVSAIRSGEHTSELQSLMRISCAVFCLKRKKHNTETQLYVLRHRTTQKT